MFINNVVLNFWSNSFKNTRDGVQFLINAHVTLSCFSSQVQYDKVRDPNFGTGVLTFDYENISYLMTFGTGRSSQKFGQFFFYVSFRVQGFRRLTFLKGEKSTLSNMVMSYISLECKFYTDLKVQKNLCLKINIWVNTLLDYHLK